MKIKLIRTGGFIPLRKEAETEVSWTKEELQGLLQTIQSGNSAPGKKRDATNYHLASDNIQTPIDWEKIPGKYSKVFEALKNKLEPAKL